MTTEPQLPARVARPDNDFGFGQKVSPSLQIMLNDKLFDRGRIVAGYMAKAEGAVPKHLLGKMEACFGVMCMALDWKLSPWMVAKSTYQTPGGSIGYEGKLCQAIMENSGMIEGQILFEHFHGVSVKLKKTDAPPILARSNDPRLEQWRKDGATVIDNLNTWDSLVGQFEMVASSNGKGKYPVARWDDKLENGLGVTVKAQVHGEAKPREFTFYLVQAEPRNSTLWVTDPRTQICYLAVRRFSSVAAPGIFMGVPFDREDWDEDTRARNARDVTPSRGPAEPEPTEEPEDPAQTFTLVDAQGEDEQRCPLASQWITELLSASAPTPEGKFMAKALAYLKNNFEASDAVMAACGDQELIAALQKRYEDADRGHADPAEPDHGNNEGTGEGPGSQPPPQDDARVAAEEQPAAETNSTESTPQAEDAAPAPQPAAAEAPEEAPPTPAPKAERVAPQPAKADPPPAAPPNGIPLPMLNNKVNALMYLQAMQEEISLATQPEQIDAMMTREGLGSGPGLYRPKSNLAVIATLNRGTSRSVEMFASQRKNDISKG